MSIYSKDSLALFGNSNHLNGFIKNYEQGIRQENEEEKGLSEAPNYYAWLCAASGLVYYRIRRAIYVNDDDHEAFDAPYKTLLDKFLSVQKLTKEQTESVLLFAKIRHLIVHKGFPNPHTAPSENEREISKGHRFDKNEVQALAEQLHSPSGFSELYDKYQIANEAISAFEKNFVHDFGSFQVSRKKR